ncbi:MAG: family 2 glycosyl transferase [Candidatus Peregrinibacteria bacterium GW2011_GWC2_33_13]|nr:MAG: family 2 glycosyl transferase [Candidatus Peregrinibacteria bacterium GW2011_GWC2_33_13]
MKYNISLNLDDANSPHTELVKSIEQNSKVLDIGCAQGYLGEYLYLEKNCDVVGIDYLPEHLEEARQKNTYKELFQLDLNHLSNELDKYTGYFDYILLGDVLEHLYEPQKLLNQIKKLLNNSGYIVISIPNVSHGSILINLMKNKFEYTSTGLLDNTHIRFFTLESFVEILNKENFEIISLNACVKSPLETEQQTSIDGIPKNVIKFLAQNPYVFCYQYIFKIKNSSDEITCQNNNKITVKTFSKDIKRTSQKLKYSLGINPIMHFLKYPKASIKNILKK